MAEQSGRFKTERLLIRRFALSDSSFIIKLLNQQSFIENIRDTGVKTTADAETYLLNGPLKSYATYNFGLSLVSLKDGTPIGMCGLIKRDTLPDVDIGFAFLPEYTGLGYATESAKAFMTYAQNDLKLKRLVAITSLTNESSMNVLKKLGFSQEKTIRLTPDDAELNLFSIHFTLN
jgi:RimJ/RimL family protein N-acetyltransferase